ncbi:MerR family transcriptional regulator [Actinomadura darangshiensis]|uniref:MerR family transcriptional regulator n=1 Tax=Actinomadura darangshiensis TaxID=705336 RepID=A0A4V2YRN9_9ACTN|nr:MerR family transcriptional regulator [Actinomadura darangshiensis]TDD66667.1 MerR family transcriptional regulator [Actinomadura darangshiensis]
MTDDTSIGIGDLATLTGVPVRTIRFYCDEGILDARRSAGGHRRFDASAVDRLRLVRRLRGLGLGLPGIVAVLTGDRSLAEAVTVERRAADAGLAALAWRRASLRAVEEAAPAGQAARLDLLAAVQDGPAARDVLREFWRRRILVPLPDAAVEEFLGMSVPEPPADPAPGQVVAYAGMVALAGDRRLLHELRMQGRVNAEWVRDEPALIAGAREAMELATPLVAAGREPSPGLALDRFVAAHAAGRGERDTPRFRRALLPAVAMEQDPRLRRYWTLFGEVTGETATAGTVNTWLVDALERAVA